MKVGIVTEYYYPLLGGISEHVHNTALRLRQRGHSVKIITSNLNGNGKTGHNGTVHQFEPATDIIRIGRSTSIFTNGSLARITLGRNLFAKLRNVLESEKFDILHVHSPLVPTLPMFALRVAECATVGTFHTYFDKKCIPATIGYTLLGAQTQRLLIDKLDGQIAVSQSCIDALTPFFKVNARIIPNGIDTSEFSPESPGLPRFDDGKKNILFLGRLDPRNGFALMTQAFGLIKAKYPNVRLIIVGDGPLGTYYRRLVPEHLQDDVHLVGPVLKERNRYYASCDVFCSPVATASFGMTLLEAMSSGKPIVATDNTGYRELLGRKEGFLTPPHNARAFADAVLRLLTDPALGEEMGKNGRQKALGFSWDLVTESITRFYEEILSRRSCGKRLP
ncbi:MAG: glycosyltransferase family 4 protein [Desulfobacteraceae bacterium]|nr:glycosyltransferase family 4 protein [Desulfobacteraceae bacterium]